MTIHIEQKKRITLKNIHLKKDQIPKRYEWPVKQMNSAEADQLEPDQS